MRIFNFSNEDFTISHYRKLLRPTVTSYKHNTNWSIPFGEYFILWSHDCGFSLNRFFELAISSEGS